MSQIAIDPARPLGTIDRKLFGGFVEHLGHCVYGGLYEEGSPLSDERGFRTDVLGLLRELRLGVLRWPGGNFVSNYHWQDGIGPKDARPRRPELAWGGEEPNRFGTDEFLAYCAELGTQPYICLNMGTGTLREALEWVEYCNSARNTYWAARRRENGRDEPYQVSYWGLGNEMYGEWQVGQMSAGQYVREATQWARAIRKLDPGAKLIGCGETGWTDWDAAVIDGLAGSSTTTPFTSTRAATTTGRTSCSRTRQSGPSRWPPRWLTAPPTPRALPASRGSPTTSGTSGTGR